MHLLGEFLSELIYKTQQGVTHTLWKIIGPPVRQWQYTVPTGRNLMNPTTAPWFPHPDFFEMILIRWGLGPGGARLSALPEDT
jgi:hypothetical protein